jgi:hypothetical protein
MEDLGARCLPLSEPQVSRRVGLLHQAGRQLSSAAQALTENLAWDGRYRIDRCGIDIFFKVSIRDYLYIFNLDSLSLASPCQLPGS